MDEGKPFEDDPEDEEEPETYLDDGPSDSDDEYLEDPVEMIKEFGAHPLMERAQRALLKQLKDTQERLKADVSLKDEEVKRLTQDRENLGVQLYALQQQLARLQISLEADHNEFNSLVDAKLQEEELLKSIEANNQEQRALLQEHDAQQKKCAAELEAINETLRQIEEYNNEVKSEISMTRRATYKAEQSMQQLEKNKNVQDLLVDNMSKRAKQLQDQIALHTGQLDAQRKETMDANGILQDTARELELIAHEKRQLMTQWKSALSGLSRRDEALAQATETCRAAEVAIHDYDMEIEGMKRKIQKEQARNESLVNVKDRIENELKYVEECLAKIKAERDQLNERFTLLSKSLAQTDGEMKKLDAAAKILGADTEGLIANLQLVTRERQKLEEEVQQAKTNHTNVNKAVKNLNKDIAKMLKKIHERENEASEVYNDIARTKVEALNQSSLNDQLKEQLSGANGELTAKEALIEKYQVEIRQRHDDIEKKMYRVDRLNKKYDKMIESAGGEENLGPMENAVKMLNRDIDNTTKECKELERDWLKRQTDLVGISAESQKLGDENAESQARVTILTQQQLRLTKSLSALKAEVKVANQTNVDLQKDVAKLNVLISSNNVQENSLVNDNFALETSCMEELKQLEKESIGHTSQIEELKRAKESLTDQIVDVERQALLWEKKIQLHKETKEALDPSVGQAETQGMEREIHRMTLRLEALKREEERLSIELERSVNKRTSIELRFKTKPPDTTNKGSAQTKANTDLTQAGVKKRIATLKKDARALSDETTRYTAVIEERKGQLRGIAGELDNVTSVFNETERSNNEIQKQINDMLYQKQRSQERISYGHTYIKKLREYMSGNVEHSNALQAERRLLAGSQALENVRDIINDLQRMHPHLTDVLERVYNMTDP
ncbi:unnamed protein product, partial [Ectocarpus fasciculatus]